ncbi:MAG: hypothetical protein Q9157_000340 [Trypethelium eluteriae]
MSSKEGDAILNRTNLTRTRSLNVLRSLGVGAAIPKEFEEDSLEQKPRSRDEQLRKQLLGRRKLKHEKSALNGAPTGSRRSRDEDDNEDKEGGRAPAIRAKKYKIPARLDTEQEHNHKITSLEREAPISMMKSTHIEEEYGSSDESAGDPKRNDASQRELKKPVKNYLDQVLSQRAEKRERKRMKRKAKSMLQR